MSTRPSSFHDLVAALSNHKAETHEAFEGMKKAFSGLERRMDTVDAKMAAVDVKQDQQIDVLHALLEEMRKSAVERGRRIEIEAQKKRADERNARWLKWVRYLFIPLAALIAHLVTKYMHL